MAHSVPELSADEKRNAQPLIRMRAVSMALSEHGDGIRTSVEYIPFCRELIDLVLNELERSVDAKKDFGFVRLELGRLLASDADISPDRKLTSDVLSKIRQYAERRLRSEFGL